MEFICNKVIAEFLFNELLYIKPVKSRKFKTGSYFLAYSFHEMRGLKAIKPFAANIGLGDVIQFI